MTDEGDNYDFASHHLVLSNLQLTTNTANTIIAMLSDEVCGKIRHVSLTNNWMHDVPDLSRFTCLRSLNMTTNYLYFPPNLLTPPFDNLYELQLSDNPFGRCKHTYDSSETIRLCNKLAKRRAVCRAAVALLRCFKWYRQPKDIAKHFVQRYILSMRKRDEWITAMNSYKKNKTI